MGRHRLPQVDQGASLVLVIAAVVSTVFVILAAGIVWLAVVA